MINIIVAGTLTLLSFTMMIGKYPHHVFPENETLTTSSAEKNSSIVFGSARVFTSTADSSPQTISDSIEQTGKSNKIKINSQRVFIILKQFKITIMKKHSIPIEKVLAAITKVT